MKSKPRSAIWLAVAIQVVAFAWEIVWHGALHPEFERMPSVAAMRHHLSTVHIPFYVGIVALLVTTGWALITDLRRGHRGLAMPIAFALALGQTVGQGWDAARHLQLSVGGPIAWTLIVLGFIGVPVVLWLDARRQRAGGDQDARRRRAA